MALAALLTALGAAADGASTTQDHPNDDRRPWTRRLAGTMTEDNSSAPIVAACVVAVGGTAILLVLAILWCCRKQLTHSTLPSSDGHGLDKLILDSQTGRSTRSGGEEIRSRVGGAPASEADSRPRGSEGGIALSYGSSTDSESTLLRPFASPSAPYDSRPPPGASRPAPPLTPASRYWAVDIPPPEVHVFLGGLPEAAPAAGFAIAAVAVTHSTSASANANANTITTNTGDGGTSRQLEGVPRGAHGNNGDPGTGTDPETVAAAESPAATADAMTATAADADPAGTSAAAPSPALVASGMPSSAPPAQD